MHSRLHSRTVSAIGKKSSLFTDNRINDLTQDEQLHRFYQIWHIALFALLLTLTGCDDPSSPEVQPVEWKFDLNVPHIELGQSAELTGGTVASEGFVVSGQYLDSGDGFLLRAMMDGQQLWLVELTHAGTALDIADDGTILIAGQTGGGAAWFARYNESGSLINQTTLDNLEAVDVKATADGGLVFVGNSGDAIELFKFSATGQNLWARTFSGSQPFSAVDMIVLENGFLIAGQGGVGEIAIPWLLIETDVSGNEIRQLAFSDNQTVVSVAQLTDGTFASLGNKDDVLLATAELKITNAIGELAREESYQMFGWPLAVLELTDGRLILLGYEWDMEYHITGRRIPMINLVDESGYYPYSFTLQNWDDEADNRNVYATCIGETADGVVVVVGYAPMTGPNETCVFFYPMSFQ